MQASRADDDRPNSVPRRDASFGPLKQIDAGVLDVGYVDAGPPTGGPSLLLHGWPYDIHSYAEVAPIAGGGGLPGRSCRTCAATARRGSCRTTRSATASRRPGGRR